MPHLVIEHSRNLGDFPFERIVPALNRSVTASPEILDEADLKTRVLALDDYRVGNQAEGRAFVHAQLRLMAGRSPEAKKDLAERIATVLRAELPRPAGLMLQLSVEIVDMDRASYVKERLA
ncbi:5-carboxymethyl-2-hydroxymuconate Delta-isomerase [Xenophilus sp. Marseille-Q4582]|uniref:5-carboxymethyl-2-hydroxymuconate Delta-isomerase n=1 Tax=Xenophilus sp. Marseille-Q4582 TaxID=2866600 RepID=UPI001CE41D92|nr:5-carboxymethyl-2-hydroxymuconate Delta-isomerase [Xenophilus sp. Marseille-Q4582]